MSRWVVKIIPFNLLCSKLCLRVLLGCSAPQEREWPSCGLGDEGTYST